MQRLAVFGLSLLFSFFATAQSNWKHGRLKVSPDGRYLQYQDGTPFFWLGDTGWEIFHRLTLPEINEYMTNRAAKGFNVIQAVALAGEDLGKPNYLGVAPLLNGNTATPNENYFALVDSTVRLARKLNMFIGLLPCWGDRVNGKPGNGRVIFDSAKAHAFGLWLGKRYKDFPNMIWIMGGDSPAKNDSADYRPIWRAMANGIIEGTDHQALLSYHPGGGHNSSSQWLQQEPWLDLNMFQSSHGSGHDTPCWELVTRDRGYLPTKPTIDGEPNYEDHPVNPWPKWNADSGYFRAYDVRKQLSRSVFAGACGVTYGHHAVWQFMSAREVALNYPDRGWINALDRPGATQSGYLRRLMESRPMPARVPDSTIIASERGYRGAHLEAFRGADNSYAMIYLPIGKEVIVNTGYTTAADLAGWWFNPKDGTAQRIGTLHRTAEMKFTSPVAGLENDWVLVLDDASKKYDAPGK